MSLFSLGGFLGDAVADIWMSIWLSLNNMIYYFISALYQVFESVANTNLFSNDVFEDITFRIYVIMGIAMLFIFAYNLILMIINPEDKKGTGQTTKVVKEVMISLVLIILLPTIFNYMSIFQKHVLKTQILSQIIFGDTGGTSSEKCDYGEYTVFNTVDIETDDNSSATEYLSKNCENYYSEKLTSSQRGAYALPITIFQAFYYPTTVDYDMCDEWIENNKDGSGGSLDVEEKKMCAYYVYDVKLSKYKGNITPFNSESKFYSKVKKDDGTFEFHYLLALVAGVLALYMFVCYTLAIGVRVAKLGFLQIISPIAVMMRIVPKQKEAMFDKWFKHLVNTYLDVFIRLIIIYFALFAISLVPDTIKTLFASIEGSNWFIRALSCVVVILGILQFAQKAPDLFKEFFGNSGNFALKSPSKQLSENKLAMSGVNAFRGGVYGATTGTGIGRLSGLLSGAGRGAVGGYDKAVKGIDTARTEHGEHGNGSTMFGRALDRARVGIGMETRAESDDRNIEKVFNTTERKKQNETVMSQIKNVKSHVEEKLERENSKVQFHVTDANGNIVEGNYDSMQKYLKSLQDNVSNATSDADRIKALKEMNIFRDNLGQQKKNAVENMVHNLMNGSRVEIGKDAQGNSIYAFNENDMSFVQTAVAEINKEIAKGGVGLQYDNDGNVISDSERTKSITSGFDLLGDFKDGIEAQSYEIQRHSSNVGKNYTARHADSRMVRGNGQSEKK